jgi:uncharacterized membrane protein
MNTLRAIASGAASLLATDLALAQNSHMMNDSAWGLGSMGGYGGLWVPILLVIVVAGLVVWIVKGRAK